MEEPKQEKLTAFPSEELYELTSRYTMRAKLRLVYPSWVKCNFAALSLATAMLAACGGDTGSQSSGSGQPEAPVTRKDLLNLYPNLEGCYLDNQILSETTIVVCRNVSDLSGLEYLPSLDQLGVLETDRIRVNAPISAKQLLVQLNDAAGLTTLDLSAFSGFESAEISIPKVKQIIFSDSSRQKLRSLQLDNVTSDDFEFPSLPKLEILAVTRSTASHLELPELPSLTQLNLQRNNFTTVNYANLENVKYVDLSSNHLTDFEVAGLDQLVSIDLANNQVEHLDLPDTGASVVVKLEGNPAKCSFIYQVLQPTEATVKTVLGDSQCVPDTDDIDLNDFIPALSLPSDSLNKCLRSTGYRFLSHVRSIDCAGPDLEGIEALASLKSLKVTGLTNASLDILVKLPISTLTIKGFDLATIDLRAMSDLKELNVVDGYILETLDLSNNAKLENLTLENTSSLYNLKVRDPNVLTVFTNSYGFQLPLENYPNIRELTASSSTNPVDFSVFNKLRSLKTNGNGAAILDLSSADQLVELELSKSISLSEVVLPRNSNLQSLVANDTFALSELDLSNQHRLTRLILKDAHKLQLLLLPTEPSVLRELVLEDAEQLASLSLISHSALQYLDITGGALSALSLPQTDAFETLILTGTDFQQLDLSGNFHLKNLRLSSLPATKIDLTSNAELNELNLAYLPIKTLDLSSNVNLTKLNVSHVPDLEALDLSGNAALKTLTLRYLSLTDLDLSSNTLLERIDFFSSKGLCQNADKILAPLENILASKYLACY